LPIADSEALCQTVIEGEVFLRVERNGLVVGWILATIFLLGKIVPAYKSVAQRARARAVRTPEVHFKVSAHPTMVKVRKHASAAAVKSMDRAAIVIEIRVAAVKAAIASHATSKAVDAFVIRAGAGPVAIAIKGLPGAYASAPK
jgi:hypothetical protein